MAQFLVGVITVGALCLIGISNATAADFRRNELFGVVGIGKTYDDEGSLGSGINGGGGFGYRLSQRFGVQVEVNAFRTRRDFGSLYPPFQANGAHLMGSGLLYVTRGRAQVYLIGGAGLLHSRVESGFAGVNGTGSANGFAVNFGGGVKAFLTPRVSLRPELRVFVAGSRGAVEPPFSDIRLSLGAGYHW